MPIKISIRPPDTNQVSKVILLDGEQVLLLLRKEGQKHAGKWDLPGGHILEGEDTISGATRETKEETNLDIRALEAVYTSGRKSFFKTRTWEGVVFSPGELPEHDDYKWLTLSQIEKLQNISPLYVEAIRRATP